MPTRQLEDIFVSYEGDNWFRRNKDLFNVEEDIPLKLIKMYDLKPNKVIDLGCSNGWRLNEIQKRFGNDIRCVGIDAGIEAIEDGKKRYPDIILKQGTLSNIPIKEEFDLVIINYVLHWVDRSLLLKSLSEIDRLVGDNGFLILGDFYSDFPQKRQYHHLKDVKVYTWKALYNQIFVSTGLYKEVVFLSYDHDKKSKLYAAVEGAKRGFCSLLRKSSEEFYFEV